MRAISFLIVMLLLPLLYGCLAREDSRWDPHGDYTRYDPSILHYHPRDEGGRISTRSDAELEKALDGECSLDVLVDLVRQKSPQLSAMKNRYLAAKHRILPAQSLENIKLMSEYERNKDMRTNEYRIGLAQEFPWPGKLDLRGRMAEQEAEIMHQDWLAMQNELVAEIKAAYFEYALIMSEIKITNENLELLKSFEKIAETQYAAGQVTQQDVLKAQVEISTLDNELIALARRKEIVIGRINTLIDRSPQAHIGMPKSVALTPLDRDPELLYAQATGNRPELRAALYGIDKGKTTVDMAKKEYFPDFMAGLEYFRMEERSESMGFRKDAQDGFMLTFEIDLSFLNKKRRDSELAAAKKDAEASEDNYRAKANEVLFQVKESYEKFKSSERLARLFKDTLIPQAEQSLNVAKKQYESGSVNFLDLLDSQRKLLEFRLDYERSLAEAHKDRAMLEKAVGVEFK